MAANQPVRQEFLRGVLDSFRIRAQWAIGWQRCHIRIRPVEVDEVARGLFFVETTEGLLPKGDEPSPAPAMKVGILTDADIRVG